MIKNAFVAHTCIIFVNIRWPSPEKKKLQTIIYGQDQPQVQVLAAVHQSGLQYIDLLQQYHNFPS